MTLIKDYTAEDLQNAFDKGRITGRADMAETIQDLKDQLHVEKLSHKDMANVLNNYEGLIRDLTDALRAAGGKTHGA